LKPILLILAAMVILSLGMREQENSATAYWSSPAGVMSEARLACTRVATAQLKAPSTAQWGWAPEMTNTSEGVYRMHTYVDAQNSFGATIRNQVTCNATTMDGRTFESRNITCVFY
jgi:hypothetical protein